MSDYHAKREGFARENARNGDNAFGKKRGIGFATFMHGAGFTGSVRFTCNPSCPPKRRWKESANARGQHRNRPGTNTIFSQIAAEALGVDFDMIDVVQPDTGRVPNSGPTVASRTSMVVGKLVESAVTALKQTLIGSGVLTDGYTASDFRAACRDYVTRFGPLRTSATYQPPPNVHWDDEKYQGDAYAAYAWAVYVADFIR